MLPADRFGVPKVLAAAAAALVAVPADQLHWDTALQLLQLPQSCVLQPDFTAAHQLAVRRMIQQLGDLEKVWASDALQQQLLALPFDALLQLLQHSHTRVATENTVVFTIERWHRAHRAACSREQVQQLMQLVRMRHCTPYYAGTIMPHSNIVKRGIGRSALPLMRECCMPGGFEKMQSANCSVLRKFPAWSAARRPKSTLQPVLEWRLPLATLQSAVEQLFSSGRAARVGLSAVSIVQGQPMQIKALVTDTHNEEATDTRSMHHDVYAWDAGSLGRDEHTVTASGHVPTPVGVACWCTAQREGRVPRISAGWGSTDFQMDRGSHVSRCGRLGFHQPGLSRG
jgi:hypothetical protein